MRLSPRLWRLAIGAAIVMLPALLPGPISATADNSNPCDVLPSLPFCDSALGPLRDVTANWRYYQPALTQPVPVADYCPNEPTCSMGDHEDMAPPGNTPLIFAAGTCGLETVNPSSGSSVPPSSEVTGLPVALTATPPPGKLVHHVGDKYCLLQYIAADFSPLCAGCHRVLIDYSLIPAKTYTPPTRQSDGHWAARFTTDSSLSATTPFNGHSPNFKNLCSDKKINPAANADCQQPWVNLDLYGHALEGDTTIFHHFPYEGRYFNGPAYLAGDGVKTPYHWVNGAYFDVDPAGATSLPVWYNAGYRGLGDLASDEDASYGCLCEVPFQPLDLPGAPGAGHTTWSPSLVLQGASSSSGGGNASSPGSTQPVSPARGTSLPNTAAPPPGPSAALAFAAALLLLTTAIALARRARAR